MGINPGEILIDDDTPNDILFDGRFGRGLVPRDFSTHPEGFLSPPAEIELIPESEWSARIKEMEELKSRISDLRGAITSLNQTQSNYCWAHSPVHCVILDRAFKGQPHLPLSAYAVGSTIKKGANEGGWCGLSAKFIQEFGVPTQTLWPQGQFRDPGNNWRANAARHKITEGWFDFSRQVWDQQLSFAQVATLLLNGVPCALDFNWWAHSVCGLDLIEVERGSFGIRIWNSWGDSWGDRGVGVLRGSKAIPNGAIAVRSTVPSVT